MNQEMPERLLLTYKSEDTPETHEEIKPAEEDPSPVVHDFGTIPSSPPQPPPPETEIGDLLVGLQFSA